MESPLKIEFKESFELKLLEYEEQHQGSQRKPWTEEKIKEVIKHIRRGNVAVKSGERRTSMEYYWMTKYDIINTDNKFNLIYKQKMPSDPTVIIIPHNEYYSIIKETHNSLNHCGRDKLVHALKTKFYIPKKAIEIFIALCPTCEMKKNSPKKSITNHPKLSHQHIFNIKGKVELLDFQCSPDGEFKWLLYYQDNASKFVSLRPLKTTSEHEVAVELLKIFMTFGAPNVLQSDNGSKFTEKVIDDLTSMCPDWDIINETRCSQSQETEERSIEDVKNMLHLWMTNKMTSNWSLGCHFVQYQINTSVHSKIGGTPYKALFRSDPKTGCSAGIPPGSILNIKREEQLQDDSVQGLCDSEFDINVEAVPKIEYNGVEVKKCDHPLPLIKSDKSEDSDVGPIMTNSDNCNKTNNSYNNYTECLGPQMMQCKAEIVHDNLYCEGCHKTYTGEHCSNCDSTEVHINNDTEKHGILSDKSEQERVFEISSDFKRERKRAAEELETISTKKHHLIEESKFVSIESISLKNKSLEHCIVIPS